MPDPGGIIRRAHDKQNPYVLISRALAEDETLSLEARGLMLYLLAKPPDWQIMMRDLQRAARCGRDQTRRILHECEAAGYIVREQTNNPANGRWQWVSMVYETPQRPSTENPSLDNPSLDHPAPEKAAIYQVRSVASNHRTKEPTELVAPQTNREKGDALLRAFFDSQIRALCRERRWPAPSRADLDALAATGYDALVVGNTARLGCLGSMQELIAAFRPGGLGPLGVGK